MLRLYLVVLFRHITKDIKYAFLPVLSLSIGISIALLTVLYLSHEHSFDRFHTNYKRIYTVHITSIFAGQESDQDNVSFATASRIAGQGGQVDQFVRIEQPWQSFILNNPVLPDARHKETALYFADPNFFRFFSFKLREGSPAEVLSRPFSMVISPGMARKYFGNADPVGQTLIYNGKYPFQITGVFGAVPSNSSLDFDFVCPVSALWSIRKSEGDLNMNNDVGGGEFTTFLLLHHNVAPAGISNRLKAMSANNQILKDPRTQFHLLPLADTHAYNLRNEYASVRAIAGIVMWVALGILCLAIINYIGLISSKGVNRSKEIGLRKILGAERSQIAGQFFLESGVLVVISFLGGVLLFCMLRKYFLEILNLHIDQSFLSNPGFILGAVSLLIVIILLSGIYPSILVSRFNPLAVVNGRWSRVGGGARVKTYFALFQFLISFVCILFSITLYRQMNYMKNRETGLSRNHVVLIPFGTTLGNHFSSLKNDISNIPGVTGITNSLYALYQEHSQETTVKNLITGKDIVLTTMLVDKNFFQVLCIDFKIRPLDSVQIMQPHAAVINEAAIEDLGLPARPLNQKIKIAGGRFFEVKAVVKNFNFESLQNKIGSLALLVIPDSAQRWGQQLDGYFIARLDKKTDPQAFLSRARKVYESYDRQTPFSFQFLDDAYQALYTREDHLTEGFTFLTGSAILLACLGLYSLVAFYIRSKLKAINIKKVLGATRMNIFVFITREILGMIIAAFVISIPVAFYFITQWLNNFAYKISVGWFLFLSALVLFLSISFLTISFQTLRIVRQSPVNGLKES